MTPIDLLVKRLAENGILHSSDIAEANELFKQQMELIYEGLLQNVGTCIKQSDLPTFEQYYNETFKNK